MAGTDDLRQTGVAARTVAQWVDGMVAQGDADRLIRGVGSIERAGPDQLAFYSGSRKGVRPEFSQAGIILTDAKSLDRVPSGATVITVGNPHLAFARIADRLYPRRRPHPGIHPDARVDADAEVDPSASVAAFTVIEAGCRIGAGAVLGSGCVLGRNVMIGPDTELVARVTVLDDCEIGARCLIQPGVVIGSDGFGLANDGGRWIRVPQVGRVVIGDDVDIGANTTIDRGALDDTRIDDGVKLDNLIQIAHNVEIGAHSAIAGCAGLAGSSKVGRYCTLGGGVGLAGHLSLVDNVHVTGMSMVTRSIHQPGVYSAGTPLDTNAHWHRNAVRFKQLDRMAQRLNELERRCGDKDENEDIT